MASDSIDNRPEVQRLLANIKARLPDLEALLARVNDHWCYEDGVYRFYHQSFKIYGQLQEPTTAIVAALQTLAPDRQLNDWFRHIVAEGTGKTFQPDHNERWLEVTRPILEAFFHARFFLEMAVKYGRELDAPPSVLPSGWAAVLCLYDLR